MLPFPGEATARRQESMIVTKASTPHSTLLRFSNQQNKEDPSVLTRFTGSSPFEPGVGKSGASQPHRSRGVMCDVISGQQTMSHLNESEHPEHWLRQSDYLHNTTPTHCAAHPFARRSLPKSSMLAFEIFQSSGGFVRMEPNSRARLPALIRLVIS